MSRKVKVFNTTTNSVVTVVSNASNWGELKNEILSHNEGAEINVDNMKAIAKFNEGKATLEFNDTPIPEGDFKVYLYALKNKSGYSDALIKEIRTKVRNIISDNSRKVPYSSFKSDVEIFFGKVLGEKVKPSTVVKKAATVIKVDHKAEKAAKEKAQMKSEADDIARELGKRL
jgi:hypothetical protein